MANLKMRVKKAKKIINEIDDRIINLRTLKNNIILEQKIFYQILKTYPSISKEYDILFNRKEKLKRFIFINS